MIGRSPHGASVSAASSASCVVASETSPRLFVGSEACCRDHRSNPTSLFAEHGTICQFIGMAWRQVRVHFQTERFHPARCGGANRVDRSRCGLHPGDAHKGAFYDSYDTASTTHDRYAECGIAVIRFRRRIIESSFVRWNLLQAATPSFRNGAYVERRHGQNLNK